ncbi:hypothetical protein [Dysgonomonas reticulitermitis]
MKFTKKIKEFILAYGRFVNFDDRTVLSTLDDELDLSIYNVYNLDYCSASDGKKNIGNDFTSVGNAFKKATNQAKQKVKDGQTSTAE